jgi:Rad3-related DNA helicase
MVVGPALPEVNPVQKARLAEAAPLGREEAFRRVYQAPGIQKVNQALGRLVRAPGQRAKVLLHCQRFAEPSYIRLLGPEYRQGRPIASSLELDNWLATVAHEAP